MNHPLDDDKFVAGFAADLRQRGALFGVGFHAVVREDDGVASPALEGAAVEPGNVLGDEVLPRAAVLGDGHVGITDT